MPFCFSFESMKEANPAMKNIIPRKFVFCSSSKTVNPVMLNVAAITAIIRKITAIIRYTFLGFIVVLCIK